MSAEPFVAGPCVWEVGGLDEALALADAASTACNRVLEVRAVL
ncbi:MULTISPECIES: hypothetical protein [unclassified Curtobacterium]|nr:MULTISPECIES: hypothetical protein [unclassified Curtobacterium]